jgi:hypothetical protein
VADSATFCVFGPQNTIWNGSLETTQITFVPQKFVVYNGQVFTRASDAVYQYGGANNNTYDNCKMKGQLPFLDANTAGTKKIASGVDVVFNIDPKGAQLAGADTIKIYASMDEKSAEDPTSGTLTHWRLVYALDQHSFDLGIIPYEDQGTHFSLYFESQGDGNSGVGGPAVFSSLILHYNAGDEK